MRVNIAAHSAAAFVFVGSQAYWGSSIHEGLVLLDLLAIWQTRDLRPTGGRPQHFLYLRPEPHQQAALRSGGQLMVKCSGAVLQ